MAYDALLGMAEDLSFESIIDDVLEGASTSYLEIIEEELEKVSYGS